MMVKIMTSKRYQVSTNERNETDYVAFDRDYQVIYFCGLAVIIPRVALHIEKNWRNWRIGKVVMTHDCIDYHALWIVCFCFHWQSE